MSSEFFLVLKLRIKDFLFTYYAFINFLTMFIFFY